MPIDALRFEQAPPEHVARTTSHVAAEKDHDSRGEAMALRRSRILAEASQLFFEKGYQASTLDMLARRLDITKPSLYVHYRSKGELLAAVCETGIKVSLDAVERGMRQESTVARQLQAIVTGVAHVVIRLQNCVVVYQREIKSLDRREAQRILQLRHDFDRRIAQLLDRGVADGVFVIEDTSMISVWIGGLLSWIPVWYMPHGRRSETEIVDSLVATVMRLVGAPVSTLRNDYTWK